ncbi:hypothetical protein B0H11DRAFT_1330540 [Mycena galericulata]|nr:hypothetical protein B0H11DRAFT_1330540 [Mycena galericulata]
MDLLRRIELFSSSWTMSSMIQSHECPSNFRRCTECISPSQPVFACAHRFPVLFMVYVSLILPISDGVDRVSREDRTREVMFFRSIAAWRKSKTRWVLSPRPLSRFWVPAKDMRRLAWCGARFRELKTPRVATMPYSRYRGVHDCQVVRSRARRPCGHFLPSFLQMQTRLMSRPLLCRTPPSASTDPFTEILHFFNL